MFRMKNLRFKLYLSIVVIGVLFVVCEGCKTSSRYSTDSTVLSINDPENIVQYIVGRKVVARSTVSGCSSVVFPYSSEDLNDLDSYGEVSSDNGISLSLDKACLPYEITLSYKCKEFEGGKYPAGRCFTGKASTFMGQIDSDSMRLEIPLEGVGEWAYIKIDSTSSLKLKDFFTSDFLKKAQSLSTTNSSLYVLSGVQDIDTKSIDVGGVKFSGANTVNASAKKCGFEWDKTFTDVVVISKISIDGKDLSFKTKSFEQVLETPVESSVYIYGYSGSIENKDGNLEFTCEQRVYRVEFGD